jgi:hypothetical protein
LAGVYGTLGKVFGEAGQGIVGFAKGLADAEQKNLEADSASQAALADTKKQDAVRKGTRIEELKKFIDATAKYAEETRLAQIDDLKAAVKA